MTLVALALLHVPACAAPTLRDGGQSGQNDQSGCHPTLTAIDPGDAVLGFSADEAMALLQEHLPTEVRWTELTQGEASTAIAVTLALAGAPAIAEPGGDVAFCAEPTPWVRIPVDMSVTLAGGQVIASGTTFLDVGALDLDRVHLATRKDLPAALSGDYATGMEAFLRDAADDHGAATQVGVWVMLGGIWAAPVVDIGVRFATAGGEPTLSAVWRGTWDLP